MEPTKYIYLDSEYNNTNESKFNVICFALVSDLGAEKYWLETPEEIEIFKFAITRFISYGYIFVSYNVESEASALISLDIDPLKMKWIDLYLEYVMLSNHNNEINKGTQLLHGREVKLPNHGFAKGSKSLAAALFKLCGIKVDTAHKTAMRDLIISRPTYFSPEEQNAILDYCLSDTEHLPELHKRIADTYMKFIPKEHRATLRDEAHWRAECSIRTALIVRSGYPIDVQRTRNLSANVPVVIRECCEDINNQFPDVMPFKWDKKSLRYTMDTKALSNWIVSKNFKGWDKTETGRLSLALESFEKHFPFRHDFPRNNLGAQILRYLKIQQSLRNFNIKGGSQDRNFFDYLGSDGMVRPYLGQYVAQSSRFQPASTGYLFLKPAFLRSLCSPPKDYLMGSIDYSSQEFLLAALLSGDRRMLEAYIEGDVYLYFAKQSGMVPKWATKETHKKERDLAKSTVLGISYSMTCIGLSRKLSSDVGHYVSEEEAQVYIDNFNEVFSTFYNWKKSQIDTYRAKGYVRLADGFFMWKDNPNDRSLTNMPIQGLGAAILRKAIQLSQNSNVTVVAPLHDSLYIMFHKDDITAMDRLHDALVEAFCFYFDGKAKENARNIRLDAEVWGMDTDQERKYTTKNMPLAVEKVHVDVRGKKEYEQFKVYFDTDMCVEML